MAIEEQIKEQIKELIETNKQLKRKISEQNNTFSALEVAFRKASDANRAWELAKIICTPNLAVGMTQNELTQCFGTYDYVEIFSIPYQEAIQKYDNWLSNQNISVGDEVRATDEKVFVVTLITNDRTMVGGYTSNNEYCVRLIKSCTKTGRHFDFPWVNMQE